MRAAWLLVVMVVFAVALVPGSWGGHAAAAGPCPSALLLASRGSGDKLSKDQGIGRPEVRLQTALQGLVPGLQTWANPYSAIGVFSWPWKSMRQIVNGLGALTKLSGLGLGAYHDSAVQGTDLLAARLHQAIRNCGGRTSIILAGYSQGAQVTADVFQRDLSPSERSKVSAVVLFGDPYFNGGDRAVDRGSFSGRRDGVLGKRPKFGSGSTLVLSYCHSHDPICQGFFFRVGPTRTPDPGALTTRQHMNYTCCQEPQEAAKLIAAHIRGATGPPVPTLPDKWPTKRNDGPPAFFEYLGASFIPPDWSSCDPDYCIAGSGDTVYVFSMRDGIDQIGTVPIDIPDPRAGLASLGIPNQDINQLLAP